MARITAACRADRCLDAAAGGGDFLVADAFESSLEFVATIAAEDEVRMTVDQRRCQPAALYRTSLRGSVCGKIGRRPDPRDGARGYGQCAVVDRAVIICAGLHRCDAGVREQQVPVRHRSLHDCKGP